jgi:hypothetical protein
MESVRTFEHEISKRLGLSYRRLEKEGVDPAKPFAEVGEDLRRWMLAMPAEAPGEIPEPAVADPVQPAPSRLAVSIPEGASPRVLKTGKRRGRRPDQERRDAIRTAIQAQGGQWRNHLDDIFTELDSHNVALGDLQKMKIELGDGESKTVSTWTDLDLADEKQRRQIVDFLRKYSD